MKVIKGGAVCGIIEYPQDNLEKDMKSVFELR